MWISNRKILIFLMIIMFVSLICFLSWDIQFKPYILWHETYYNNMIGICSGISLYKGKTGRLPESLKEMVEKGYLPAKSEIYFCPLKHGIKSNKEEMLYSECEYNIIFEPNKIVISIPKEVFEDNRYKYIDEKHRKREMLIIRDQH